MLLYESCLIDTMWYLCSNRQVIQLIFYRKKIVDQQNSVFNWKWSNVQELILRQQIFHGLSSACKSAGVKSSWSIITLLKVNSAWSKQESVEEEISLPFTNNNSCSLAVSVFLSALLTSFAKKLSFLLKEFLDYLGFPSWIDEGNKTYLIAP